MNKIVIVGLGAHAKIIADEINREKKYKILGFIDAFNKKTSFINPFYNKLKVLGGLEYFKKKKEFSVIIAVGSNHERFSIYKKIVKIKSNIKWANY